MLAEGMSRSGRGVGVAGGAGVAAGAVAGVEESARTGPGVTIGAEEELPEEAGNAAESAHAEFAVSPKSTPPVMATASDTPSQVFNVRLRFDLMISPSIQLS